MNESGTRVQRRLPPHPSSAGEARRMVRHLLTDAGRDDLVDSAQLLVSEVVTNALVHSGTSIDLSMALAGDGVLVEVGDGSHHLPVRRHYAPTASTGRGLALLEGTASAWGIVPGVRGKTVWFQLTSGNHVEPEVQRRPATVTHLRPRTETVQVELLDVPLLLHAAWQQHIEAMLREYLLARLDGDTEDDPLFVHACATDALALLAEHIPRPDVGVRPEELMSTAVDPHVSSPRVVVPVPVHSVPHFAVLDDALGVAVEMGERGLLLAPPVQPELRVLRRWLCGEVRQQAAGAGPTPWPPPVEEGLPPSPALEWDASAVTTSAQAVIAADATDRIIAASPGVLDLLGYEHGGLVGERLVSIIPTRYRQAHLAGFTLHLLTGRGPLLDEPVVVPALRRDGSEITVHLDVHAQRAAHGQSVFVATMREYQD